MIRRNFSQSSRYKFFWMALYLLFGSMLPIIFLFSEFSYPVPKTLAISDEEAFSHFVPDVITAYSPLFIYGLLAGFIIPLYIIPAYQFFDEAIQYAKAKKAVRTFRIAAICVALLVAFSDFFLGDPAIWELAPPAHERFVSHFLSANDSTAVEAKIAYRDGISKTLKDGGASIWSITRVTYFFSVLIEAYFLNLFFYICFLYSSFSGGLKHRDKATFYKRSNGLVIASLLVFFWLLLRSANALEKADLYPFLTLHVTDIAVGCLNILCLFAVLLARLNNKKLRKTTEEVLTILAGLGISVSSVVTMLHMGDIDAYFGKRAGLINYVVFPIVFMLLYFAYMIVNLGADYSKDVQIPPDPEDVDYNAP